MNERKRLIELLDAATSEFRFDSWENSDKIADYLIANGVVVFPCKIGDTIYRVCSPSGTRQQPHIKRYKVSRVNFCKAIEDYGTLVFPTEKEAWKAVKGAVKAKQNAERVANGREKAD